MFSTASVPFYILTGNVQGFEFLHILANTYFSFFVIMVVLCYYYIYPRGCEVKSHCSFVPTSLEMFSSEQYQALKMFAS